MQIQITYDQERDIENIIKATSSKNSSKPTSFQKEYIELHGNSFEHERVRSFLNLYHNKHGVSLDHELSRIRREWSEIKKEAIDRLTRIFNIMLEDQLIAYLTTDSRCTYNTRDGYFFVSFTSTSNPPNLIILHELLHFYTWEKYHDNLINRGVSEKKYNDLKESLTVLLNIEFADLLSGHLDIGYLQHQEMRKQITDLHQQGNDLDAVLSIMSTEDSNLY